jgi:DNA-binding PadR family transcriptional regulator
MIDWLRRREGNAPIFEVLALFAAFDYNKESIIEVLDALEAKEMIQRDGRTNRGKHYALTPRGRELCALFDKRHAGRELRS